jgi:hypothetical protein
MILTRYRKLQYCNWHVNTCCCHNMSVMSTSSSHFKLANFQLSFLINPCYLFYSRIGGYTTVSSLQFSDSDDSFASADDDSRLDGIAGKLKVTWCLHVCRGVVPCLALWWWRIFSVSFQRLRRYFVCCSYVLDTSTHNTSCSLNSVSSADAECSTATTFTILWQIRTT